MYVAIQVDSYSYLATLQVNVLILEYFESCI